jgi:hypothetical protein
LVESEKNNLSLLNVLTCHVHSNKPLFWVDLALELEHFLAILLINDDLHFFTFLFSQGKWYSKASLDVDVVAISIAQ